MPMVAPVIAGLAAAVTLREGGRPLFGHTRIGRGGRPFRCWKIRSMVPDAEARLARHLAENPGAAEEWRATRKLADDPRVTRFGEFLRRTSLDELPQIWNVLRGEMSFVGPRPVPADELKLYGAARAAYQAMRPGITGLWQVSGRNEVAYAERVQLDVNYLRRMSFWFDLKVILLTGGAVLRFTGR
ncbi:MAG: sugar transferase [Pseudomonadota bacterium]